MSDQSANQAAGQHGHVLATGQVTHCHGRRITADSFRSLTARLKPAQTAEFAVPPVAELLHEPLNGHQLPFQPPVETPAPVSAEAVAPAVSEPAPAHLPELPPLPQFVVPDFVPLTPFQPIDLAEPSSEVAGAAPSHGDSAIAETASVAPSPSDTLTVPSLAVPAIELQPFSPETFWAAKAEAARQVSLDAIPPPVEEVPEVAPEALAAAADVPAEAFPPPVQPATGEPAEQPVEPESQALAAAPLTADQPEVEQPAVAADLQGLAETSPETAAQPDPAVKTASPLVERVIDAMLKTVTEAIYAKPTAAERAAFLRDIATLLEAEPSSEAAAPSVAPVAMVEVVAAAKEETPVVSPEAAPALAESLADRLGPTATVLRKTTEVSDPFAKTERDAIRLYPKLVETVNADEDSGDLALSLLDMMSAGSASGLPQERALAADTLLRMIPRVPVKQLITVVERMAIMESPPSLLVAKLIRDPRAEVIAPLLERCMHITDQDLITASTEGDNTKRRMIARRRILSPVLADHLIDGADPSVVLTLIRNPGASFSHEAFYRLAEQASAHHALLAPLCTRADLPAPVAFELFWFVPPELRRFIFSRFLTDSETLNKILKITLATQDGAENKFPSRDILDEALDLAIAGKSDQAAQVLATAAGVCPETTMRILADREGEPLTVILKALGYSRTKFEESMERLKNSDFQLLNPGRNVAELQSIFDMLSFNKARILLTYWDWYVQKSGPYAPHN